MVINNVKALCNQDLTKENSRVLFVCVDKLKTLVVKPLHNTNLALAEFSSKSMVTGKYLGPSVPI